MHIAISVPDMKAPVSAAVTCLRFCAACMASCSISTKTMSVWGGIRGMKELERRVNSGSAAVAFAMFPTTLDQLMAIADAGEIMPPKSTWFEPKLRSGLVVHPFD